MQTRPSKLLDQVRVALRLRHCSPKTEGSYVHWIRRYVLFHNKRHPNEMGETEIESFLTHLATTQRVAASTQNQAFSALLFLYRHVLKKDLSHSIDAVCAKRSKHLPTVLTKAEVQEIIASMSGTHQLMTELLYGAGLRVSECVQLRVKDVSFATRQITIRDPKGKHDLVTMPARQRILSYQQKKPLRNARA